MIRAASPSRLFVAVACVAMAGGCVQSRVDSAAPVSVSGTVRAPDGSPLSGRPLRLGGGVGTAEGAFAVLTLGLVCTAGVCRGRVFDTTTAADGSYRFALVGRDTQSSFGEAVTQMVAVSAAPRDRQVSGAAASARFRVQTTDVRLPVLDLVDPGLTVTGAGEVVARWSTPHPGPYELTFEKAELVPVWRTVVSEGAANVDPRVLEDSSGRVVVSGGSTDRIEGSDVALHWRSPGVAYVAGAGPPPSRGRPCRFVSADGAVAGSSAAKGCPVTDGDLLTSASVPFSCPSPGSTVAASTAAPACPRPVSVVVDLGRAVPAGLVVVRGCEGGCAVEVSADGVAYRPAGAVSEGFGSVGLDGQPVTSVRVGLGSGGTLRELSVWGPRPGTASLRSVDEGSDRLRREFGVNGADRGLPVAVGAVAVGLACAVLIGLGFVLGSRRPGS